MDLGIEGRRAAIAGASGGLGFAIARSLAREGVRVAICGRDRERIDAAAASMGGGVIPLVADVSSEAGASDFVARAADVLGGAVDILLANGGGPPAGQAAGVDVEQLRDAVERSLFAHVAMVEAALPAMREKRWGRILAITTVGVREPLPTMVYSNVARTGLTGYLKQLSREVIRDGITVNSLLPNSHRTGRLESMIPDLEGYAASLVSGRLGSAGDFGEIGAFLCSEQANYLTGIALPVDGGSGASLG
jgi:3-oxoacyl-[acyl-carrier protein] reductase